MHRLSYIALRLHQPYPLTPHTRVEFERFKREFLKIKDIKIGDGPVTDLGRKVSMDVEMRRSIDNALIYSGLGFAYAGIQGTTMIHNHLTEKGALSFPEHIGLILGLNGMAIGGKRRITSHPKLICGGYGAEEANPNISCLSVNQDRLHGGNIKVRKEALIVEATLKASCILSRRLRLQGYAGQAKPDMVNPGFGYRSQA